MADWFEPLPIPSAKCSPKWNAKLGVAPSEKISKPKRRQACACDWCRHSKKRCDGNSPCQRCQKAKRECVYTFLRRKRQESPSSPTSSSPVSSPAPASSTELSPTNISPAFPPPSFSPTEAIARNYSDVFFDRMYMLHRLFPEFALCQSDQSSGRAALLQLYATAANASRAYGGSIGSSLYRSFEDRAQQLARELFDDISPQTAYGFHLLSYHTRGRDVSKSNYYRDLSISMCDQLLRPKGLSPQSRNHILHLKLINNRLRELSDPGPSLDADMLRGLNKAAQILAANMARFRRLLSTIVHDENESHTVVLRILSPAQCQEGCQTVESKMAWLRQAQMVPPQYEDIFGAFCTMLKTVILFAGGEEKEALGLLHRAVDVMEVNLDLMFASDVAVMDCFHLCFLVAYTARDVPLMKRIQAIQVRFSLVLSSYRDLVERDGQRLAEIEKQATNETPSEPSIALPCDLKGEEECSPLPPPPFVQPELEDPSTVPSPSCVESFYTQAPSSLFSFMSSPSMGCEGQYGGLFSSSDTLPFSLEEFIDSLGS